MLNANSGKLRHVFFRHGGFGHHREIGTSLISPQMARSRLLSEAEMVLKLISFDRLKPEKGINYCRDHLRRKVKAGEFPEPVALSDRRIAWREDEIEAWLASRPRRVADGR